MEKRTHPEARGDRDDGDGGREVEGDGSREAAFGHSKTTTQQHTNTNTVILSRRSRVIAKRLRGAGRSKDPQVETRTGRAAVDFPPPFPGFDPGVLRRALPLRGCRRLRMTGLLCRSSVRWLPRPRTWHIGGGGQARQLQTIFHDLRAIAEKEPRASSLFENRRRRLRPCEAGFLRRRRYGD